MVARARNRASSKKVKAQPWISYPPSLIPFIFQCWFHPFQHTLAFWDECLIAFAVFDTRYECLTYAVRFIEKLRRKPGTRKIYSWAWILNAYVKWWCFGLQKHVEIMNKFGDFSIYRNDNSIGWPQDHQHGSRSWSLTSSGGISGFWHTSGVSDIPCTLYRETSS